MNVVSVDILDMSNSIILKNIQSGYGFAIWWRQMWSL